MSINMAKDSQNVDKRYTCTFLARSYNHVHAVNDKSKTTLIWFSYYMTFYNYLRARPKYFWGKPLFPYLQFSNLFQNNVSLFR